MSVKLPTKAPEVPPEKTAENKFDPFRPEMPQIPGLGPGSHPVKHSIGGADSVRVFQIGGIAAAALLVCAVVFWWVKSKPRGEANELSGADVTDQAVPAPPAPNPIAAVQEGPTVAATVDELSKPWDAKKFTFVNMLTQEHIPAMAIRLPGGGLWAFSLQGPFGHCALEYVTDLERIATQYKYTATHPMVVNPCDSTVYDPLKVGPLGGNTWARGEIVQGSSLRPPISIDLKVRGRSILADSIE
jgi:hypothetical protein